MNDKNDLELKSEVEVKAKSSKNDFHLHCQSIKAGPFEIAVVTISMMPSLHVNLQQDYS